MRAFRPSVLLGNDLRRRRVDFPREFGVFFLEGEWDLGELGSESLSGAMETLLSCGVLDDLVHRDVCTVAEFEKLARRWAFESADYFDLAYFASHGSAGRMWLDDDESVSLQRSPTSWRMDAPAAWSTLGDVRRSGLRKARSKAF